MDCDDGVAFGTLQGCLTPVETSTSHASYQPLRLTGPNEKVRPHTEACACKHWNNQQSIKCVKDLGLHVHIAKAI